MKTVEFFQETLALISNQSLTKDSLCGFQSDKYIEDETTRLKFYLMDRDRDDRIIVSTWVVEMLFYAYYEARSRINPKSSDDMNRSLMFLYERQIIAVFTRVLWALQIKLKDDFIREWELKTEYFPFKILFEGKPMPFVDGLERRAALPKELDTDEAKRWLQVAIDGGLLNADYSTTGKTATKPQKALLAEILSGKIGLECKYKPFEELWNVRGLSKTRYKSREETGNVKGGEAIENVFKDK